MTPAAISRLRDTCAVADQVLADAQVSLTAQPPDHRDASERIATARRILRSGVTQSRPGQFPPASPDA